MLTIQTMNSTQMPDLAGGVLLGIGIDLVEVNRIRAIHQRQGERFLQRVYSPEEIEYCMRCRNPYPGLAARFAAKEAVSKAFRTGIGETLKWTSACVTKGALGEPYIALDELGKALLTRMGGDEVMISLTHTLDHAQAIAAIVRHIPPQQ
jgi:holo-[acyl-carrier protein] synthase